MEVNSGRNLTNQTALNDLGGKRVSQLDANIQNVEDQKRQFGDVFKQIQAQHGGKQEKAREIKKTLGKDDFLRIMISQMKNQDPTEPFKAEKFASELAQFASVEQLSNINKAVNKLTEGSNPAEKMAMTSMIGKIVTIDRERFPHQSGEQENLSFNLDRDAKEVKVVVFSEAGEQMTEKDLGPLKSGSNSFLWDGENRVGAAAKAGNYVFKVEAKDEKGATITTNPKSKSRVVGVSFENSEPVFLVGDINKPDKVTMRNISRIDSDGFGAIPGAVQGATQGAVQGAALGNSAPQSGATTSQNSYTQTYAPSPADSPLTTSRNNYFTFQKGKGSANLEEVQGEQAANSAQAIAMAEARKASLDAASEAQKKVQSQFVQEKESEPKGFAHGIPNSMSSLNNGNVNHQGGE